MKLTEIRIDNFRSIKERRLHISEVTAVYRREQRREDRFATRFE